MSKITISAVNKGTWDNMSPTNINDRSCESPFGHGHLRHLFWLGGPGVRRRQAHHRDISAHDPSPNTTRDVRSRHIVLLSKPGIDSHHFEIFLEGFRNTTVSREDVEGNANTSFCFRLGGDKGRPWVEMMVARHPRHSITYSLSSAGHWSII